jgi:peptidoglycan hydrolase CwlO-like protein
MADHRMFTVLTRINVARLLAVAVIGALVGIASPAAAQTTQQRITATRNAIDVAAQRWFTAQNDARELDARIAAIERTVANGQSRVNQVRTIATARALAIYKGATDVYTGLFGNSALEYARRAELIDRANATSQAAIEELTAASDALRHQRDDLLQQRSAKKQALQTVAAERVALDAQLADLRAQVQRQGRASRTAARLAAARTTETNVLATATAPGATVAATAGAAAAVPDRGRVSPHHNEPFLVCTRFHESRGDYAVVSPSGYYGAYQFLPSTWDSTAAHAGRLDLIGVLPSRASEYDQDEMAWVLYQWQGNTPWAGRC